MNTTAPRRIRALSFALGLAAALCAGPGHAAIQSYTLSSPVSLYSGIGYPSPSIGTTATGQIDSAAWVLGVNDAGVASVISAQVTYTIGGVSRTVNKGVRLFNTGFDYLGHDQYELSVGDATAGAVSPFKVNLDFTLGAGTLISSIGNGRAYTSVNDNHVLKADVTDLAFSAVPEPVSLALVALGLAGVAATRRRTV